MKPEYYANPIDPAGSVGVMELRGELCEFVLRLSETPIILGSYDPALRLKGEFLDFLISGKLPAMSFSPELRDRRTSFGREP